MWQDIISGARDLPNRLRTVPCEECLRPIRCGNRRTRLSDDECWLHLQCWKDRLFFKTFVAEQIRCMQVALEDTGTGQDVAAENEPSAPATMSGPIERPVVVLETTEQVSARTRGDEIQPNGNLSLQQLRETLSYLLARFVSRPPPTARLCMLCGAAEFSEKSIFCSRCGTSLRP